MTDPVVEPLVAVVTAQSITIDTAELRRFGSDLYFDGSLPVALVRPRSVDELQEIVRVVTSHGVAVVARGGGVSYTAGYAAEIGRSVLVDTTGLDRILEVSIEDGYVTCQAGCTWSQLSKALSGSGFRPAFYGPFSGGFATVGGAISQNAVVWGTARHGTSAESVLSLAVVTADGTLLRTGHDSTAKSNGGSSAPHYRPYGPDLTGLFLGDCGALGIKATVTLRLVAEPDSNEPLTFTFREDPALVEAMVELSRRELGATIVATDAAMARQRIRRFEVEQGRLPDDGSMEHTLHVLVEGTTPEAVEAEASLVREVCGRHGGTDRGPEATQRLVDLRFITMTSSVGPRGERWAPMHLIVTRSDAVEAWQRLRTLESEESAGLEAHDVTVGYLLTTASTQALIIEPALYWPGPRRPIHDLVLTPDERALFPENDVDSEADEFVGQYRAKMAVIFDEMGAAHLQIGRTYPYAQRREPATLALLSAIKSHLDPSRLMNPGVLGL